MAMKILESEAKRLDIEIYDDDPHSECYIEGDCSRWPDCDDRCGKYYCSDCAHCDLKTGKEVIECKCNCKKKECNCELDDSDFDPDDIDDSDNLEEFDESDDSLTDDNDESEVHKGAEIPVGPDDKEDSDECDCKYRDYSEVVLYLRYFW